MWSLLAGRSPPTKSNATTAVNALSVALATSHTVASSALLRHTAELPALDTASQRSVAIKSAPAVGEDSRPTSTAPSPIQQSPPSREVGGGASRASQVVVFLDGDGDCFRDGLLDQRYNGGRVAAIEVHDRAAEWLQRKLGAGVDVEVSVMLFWNKAGLEGHLSRSKNGKAYDLGAFSHGFNTSPFAAVAVDTGVTSQSADNALKAHLAVRLKTADYILLGGCHDGGYADYLHQLEHTQSLGRISLLKTSALSNSKFEGFGLEWLDWQDLFGGCAPLADSRYAVVNGVRVPRIPRADSSPALLEDTTVVPTPVERAQEIPRAQPSRTFAAAASPAAVVPQASSAALPPGDSNTTGRQRFQPLFAVLSALRSAGRDHPLRGLVGEELRKRYPRSLYASFNEYAKEAERLGLVTLGRGAVEGTEWIRLRLPPATAHPSTTTTRPVPGPFLPLITLLCNPALQRPEGPGVPTGMLGSRLGAHIYAQVGATRLKDYVRKAELLGLAKMAGRVGGGEWVELLI